MRRRVQLWRVSTLAICIAAGVVTGCSPASYQAPVNVFADATSTAVTTSEAQIDKMVQNRTDLLLQQLEDPQNRWTLRPAPNECDNDSDRCTFVVGPANGVHNPLIPKLKGNLIPLLQSLVAYARGLQDVVNDDTADKVKASLAAATGSAKNLAKAVEDSEKAHQLSAAKKEQALASKKAEGKDPDSPEGKEKAAADKKVDNITNDVAGSETRTAADAKLVTEYALPTGNIVSWFIGQYVAYRQVQALRSATATAEPWMQRAAPILKELSDDVADPDRSAAQKDYKNSLRSLEGHETDITKQKSLIAAGAKYNDVLVATHLNVFSAMVAAHTKLHDRLAGDETVTLGDVSAAVQDFAIRVGVLQKALASLPTR